MLGIPSKGVGGMSLVIWAKRFYSLSGCQSKIFLWKKCYQREAPKWIPDQQTTPSSDNHSNLQNRWTSCKFYKAHTDALKISLDESSLRNCGISKSKTHKPLSEYCEQDHSPSAAAELDNRIDLAWYSIQIAVFHWRTMVRLMWKT